MMSSDARGLGAELFATETAKPILGPKVRIGIKQIISVLLRVPGILTSLCVAVADRGFDGHFASALLMASSAIFLELTGSHRT